MLSSNDIKEELSLAYVRAVACRAGFAVEEIRKDRDSVDVTVRARGPLSEDATLFSPALDVQLKATVLDPVPDGELPFDLPVKNFNDLAHRCLIPRILVVFVMPESVDQWLSWSEEALVLRRGAYWLSLHGREPTPNTSTQRVALPRHQVFEPNSLRKLLERVGREEEVCS